ncbi:MAG: hypothetical protein LBF93_06735 [Zoogloeaceae bacterium]|jgi:hypothetical protein|nr:hypothetical protein [Zoogloeaceae bacterium]
MQPIFNYSAATGEFTGASYAAASPLEPGEYLIPANATTKAPPEAGEHETPVFKSGEWTLLADWRGVTLHDVQGGAELEITEIGKTPDDYPGHTTTPPPPVGEGERAVFRDGAWETEALPPARVLTHYAFRGLLTLDEQVILDNFDVPEFAAVHPKLENLGVIDRAKLRTAMASYRDAQEINLDDPGMMVFVGLLAQLGLLDSADRAARIFSGQTPEAAS